MQRGFVEQIRPFQIRGWALDGGSDVPASVHAMLRGIVIATASADMYRDDLMSVGPGTGRHGFVINLNQRLDEADTHELVVVVIGQAAGQFVLPLLPEALQAAPDASRAASRADEAILWPDPVPTYQRPLFILGPARSGTSAIAQALLRTTHYLGDEEGHFFDVVLPLLNQIEQHYVLRGEEWAAGRSTTIARVPESVVRREISNAVRMIAMRLFSGRYWIDKTPRRQMIVAAASLKAIWPECRFVFAKRRGLENIQSRLRKFPTLGFEQHCTDWSETMMAWAACRAGLLDCSIEIDQMDIARAPDNVAAGLADFLDLPPDQARRLAVALGTDFPERTSNAIQTALDLSEMGWPPEQHAMFDAICGPAMTAFGYTTDRRYRAS